MDVINLKEQFGDRYKIEYEKAYKAQRERTPDPWLMIIPCAHGHVYTHGGEFLAAATKNNGATATKLLKLVEQGLVRVARRGSDGVDVIFHVRDFDKIAAIMKPRRRRRLKGDHKKRTGDQGRRNLKRYRKAQSEKPKRKRKKDKPGDSDAA